MHVDIALYEKNKNIAIDYYKRIGDINRAIATVASFTMVPAIVVAYWIGEHTNWHPDAVRAIERLIDFYGYTSIENKPPGSPL